MAKLERSPLLRLPTELRLEIYRHLLPSSDMRTCPTSQTALLEDLEQMEIFDSRPVNGKHLNRCQLLNAQVKNSAIFSSLFSDCTIAGSTISNSTFVSCNIADDCTLLDCTITTKEKCDPFLWRNALNLEPDRHEAFNLLRVNKQTHNEYLQMLSGHLEVDILFVGGQEPQVGTKMLSAAGSPHPNFARCSLLHFVDKYYDGRTVDLGTFAKSKAFRYIKRWNVVFLKRDIAPWHLVSLQNSGHLRFGNYMEEGLRQKFRNFLSLAVPNGIRSLRLGFEDKNAHRRQLTKSEEVMGEIIPGVWKAVQTPVNLRDRVVMD